jgi:hypothetical protein
MFVGVTQITTDYEVCYCIFTLNCLVKVTHSAHHYLICVNKNVSPHVLSCLTTQQMSIIPAISINL